MKYKLQFTTLIALVFSMLINAQENTDLSLESTINNQFEYTITNSRNYQNSKVVKKTWLYTLKAHVIDSLDNVKKQIQQKQDSLQEQTQRIKVLKSELGTLENELSTIKNSKYSFSFFGIPMEKGSYKLAISSIIIILLLVLSFLIYKLKSNTSLTKIAKEKLLDLEKEYEEHRRVALEREQKVRRQLQDELNKKKS